MIKTFLKQAFTRLGFQVSRIRAPDPFLTVPDLNETDRKILLRVAPFTLTGVERRAALIDAVKYIVAHRIPGDIAECGVWRGGSMMTIALTLLELGETSRKLYLFDTFEGMSAPTDLDKDLTGRSASEMLKEHEPRTGLWAYASLDDVRRNILSTGYPAGNIVFVQGKVEDTIPGTLPAALSLLRLDTDWYESTRHELMHLYPQLSRHGLLLIDDYGHFQGARQAVDEFLRTISEPFFLHRIDYTARIAVKP